MTALPRDKRVLSGIQASGVLHLGNYFGAMRQHIALQADNDAIYFIADLHSLNSVRDRDELRRHALGVALDYLALGLDPERAVFYRQSDFPEVTELTWLLSTVTPMGLLERCHSYKDKLAQGAKPDHGLFAYPVLMAADILIHDSELVPVGQDQKQHIEVTRDIATKWNQTHGDVFRLPEPYILPDVAVVPGIDGRKMSKSYNNTIQMFAPEKTLRKQVMRIVSDSLGVDEPKDPDASNVYALWSLFAAADERAEMAERFRAGGVGYGDVKQDLLARILDHFGGARARRDALARDEARVEEILRDGVARARERSAPLMDAVRSSCGVGRPGR